MNRSRNNRLIFVAAMVAGATFAFYFNSGSLDISANVWADLLTVVLLAGIPVLSIIAAIRRKRERVERARSLRRTIATLFIIFFLLAMAAFDLLMAQTRSFDWTGFHLLSPSSFSLWLVALMAGLLLIEKVTALMRERGWLWSRQRSSISSSRHETASERRLWYFLAAPLVAAMEEFLYRGYLFNEIPDFWHTHPLACAWIASSLAFGLARFQKDLSRTWGGIATGFLLGSPVVFSGSLFPSMAAHALYSAAKPQLSSH